jgi:hypothetical protein
MKLIRTIRIGAAKVTRLASEQRNHLLRPRVEKRQRTAALQDAGASPKAISVAACFWCGAVLCRFLSPRAAWALAKSSLRSVAYLALVLASAAIASAQPTNTPSRQDFKFYDLITQRNIFNPRRSPAYVPVVPGRRTAPARVDWFALIGTMSYEKGPFAFFSGTSSDYRKALKLDDTIAGYKVTDIENSFVKLASPTNEIELKVGMALRRENHGEWRITERPELVESSSYLTRELRTTVSPEAAQGQNSDNAPGEPAVIVLDSDGQPVVAGLGGELGITNAPAGPGADPNEDPVLARLRARREQEAGR